IDQAARKDKPHRISELKGEDDVGVVDLGPVKLTLQRRFEDADDLPIDVIDGRRKKQQRAHDPADVPGARCRGRRRRGGCDGHVRILSYWLTPLARNPPSTVRMCPVTKLAA